ncbi:hypothetical protein HD806DRAFT_528616 [Xylariaceae sp. AK1471]|nr:hypothetical protein HD806DRAFT_528616 [Xylariaceae sp. AK1471]
MPHSRHEEPKPYRLYMAIYDMCYMNTDSKKYHWAFVIRGSNGTILLDATNSEGIRHYREREWDANASKVWNALCDIMDLKNDQGVEKLRSIAGSVGMPKGDDTKFCQTWAEGVLDAAAKNGYVLRASKDQIVATLKQAAKEHQKKRWDEPFQIVEI